MHLIELSGVAPTDVCTGADRAAASRSLDVFKVICSITFQCFNYLECDSLMLFVLFPRAFSLYKL